MSGLSQTSGTALAGPPLEQAVFNRLASLAHREAGLSISPSKAAMVRTRLARRLRALKLANYDDYTTLVESDAGAAERREMISALTTNVSHFFREDHHFERLQNEVFPALRQKLAEGARVRIWSAGCSNGQEPYSIAMSLLDGGPLPPDADIRILASDIDPNVIAFGHQGKYHERMLSGLAEPLRQKYLIPCQDDPDHFEVAHPVKDLVVFRELNLLTRWPMRGQFDVVFCRNVVIYFDQSTQDQLWNKFSQVMAPGAWLFLGHSERVSERCAPLFDTRGITAYQRSSVKAPPSAPQPACP